MNRVRGKNLMSVALIALLILNLYTVIPSKAQEDLYPTDVSIQPPSISWTYPEHDLLETFEVTLYVHNVTDLWAWQAGLYFNPDVLNVTYFEEGPFLKQGGTTLWMKGTIDNTTGVITYFVSTLLAPALPVSGSGDLAYIGFQVINYGNSTLDLITTDYDPAELVLSDSNLDEIPCDVYDGYFELPPPVRIPGDIDGDGDVDSDDFYLFAGAYGTSVGDPTYNPDADLEGDGDVDSSDFYIFAGNYGKST